MYERHTSPLISRAAFVRRVIVHVSASGVLIAASLIIGMMGYALFEGLSWEDSFLNASMILGGMGPVNMPQTDAGKIFAGCYALYAGLVFLIALAIVITPVFHRVLHVFHIDDASD
ncbi:MAG: hypothetical protein FGM32_09180 [Candidatus Kapabacteria bacterium]|nr:hypothetical protein [Candidatus Kapabacteria bacterium]